MGDPLGTVLQRHGAGTGRAGVLRGCRGSVGRCSIAEGGLGAAELMRVPSAREQ